jgi:hypothetical protein
LLDLDLLSLELLLLGLVLELGDDGVITVSSGIAGVDGDYVLTPTEAGTDSGVLEWSCAASDIEPKYLPANCRTAGAAAAGT